MFNVTPKSALRYTKMSVFLLRTWPLPRGASRTKKRVHEVLFWVSAILPAVMVSIMFYAMHYQLRDHLSFTKTLCIAVACSQVFIKMMICKGQRSRLEMLHRTLDDFIENATPRESKKLEEYCNRCSLFHVAINLCAFLGNLGMICGPLILSQHLPVTVKYPFSVDYSPALELAYIHQAVVGFQCASIGSVDCQASLLVWFAGARLELLAEEFENVTSDRQFDQCIKKHQSLLEYVDLALKINISQDEETIFLLCFVLRFAEESIRATRFIVLITIFSTILSVITGGVQLVTSQPFIVKSQFFAITCGFMAELFISAWPAENLINTCVAVGQGAYNCRWVNRFSYDLRRKILIVMMRSQIPGSISIPGLVPNLSLSYYASFLSRTYSYFTTLRIVIDKLKF